MNSNNNTKQKHGKKQPIYLEPSRILRFMQDNAPNLMGSRGNQAYVLATTELYDKWVRINYDLQVWQLYLKMGTQDKYWSKEVIKRTKRRDDNINTRFTQKKINQLTMSIADINASITNFQIELATYWTQALDSTTGVRDFAQQLEKCILPYIQHCTQHVKKLSEEKIKLAKAQMEEYKALQQFEAVAAPTQWSIHSMLKMKMKVWNTKNKNYQIATKRVEYDLPPLFISKVEFNFKCDESILNSDEAQDLYDRMRQITKDYRTRSMTLYLQSITREREILTNEIDRIIQGLPNDNAEGGVAAFKKYHDLRIRRFKLEAEQSCYFLEEQRVAGNVQLEEAIAPTVTRQLSGDFSLQQ
ncbi:unnamed protein product [Adineta steineri]|uniref:Uncharacterized protein n=1 Tax=Adineta steineri TaxID=433720 RepID=A0A815R5Y6_9BILA|nr:unnamed protein product [Adineta steineri]CAF1463231.1 unnamed protein product [Adineta steineri]CAF1472647.1 unnamed protein product [Adineta steineri]CAF1477966.1 unnamed protein product [Adineta steineri]CAF1527917.1 unnamed protein product [Adineta steineri]